MTREAIRFRYRLLLVSSLCIAIVLLLILLWPSQPFRFLQFQIPVSAKDQTYSNTRRLDRCYAFKADFDKINQRVTEELTPLGFKLIADDHYFGPRAVQYEREIADSSGNSHRDHVTLFQDMHYKLPQHGEPYSVVGYDDLGWVSFQVSVEVPLGKIDLMIIKVRQWLGL